MSHIGYSTVVRGSGFPVVRGSGFPVVRGSGFPIIFEQYELRNYQTLIICRNCNSGYSVSNGFTIPGGVGGTTSGSLTIFVCFSCAGWDREKLRFKNLEDYIRESLPHLKDMSSLVLADYLEDYGAAAAQWIREKEKNNVVR